MPVVPQGLLPPLVGSLDLFNKEVAHDYEQNVEHAVERGLARRHPLLLSRPEIARCARCAKRVSLWFRLWGSALHYQSA